MKEIVTRDVHDQLEFVNGSKISRIAVEKPNLRGTTSNNFIFDNFIIDDSLFEDNSERSHLNGLIEEMKSRVKRQTTSE